jgi:hypothetical protein
MKISFSLELDPYDTPTIKCTEEATGMAGYGQTVDLAVQDLIEELQEHPLSWRNPENLEEKKLQDYLIENNCFWRR